MDETKRTVMVVDDDMDFRAQLEIQLQDAGYTVVALGGRSEAEAWLKDHRPDAAVVDLMMEEVDGGFALCYHIKKKDAGIPVVLVTAVTSETGLEFDTRTDEERSWVKADAMLAKPVRFEQLRGELERLLKE